MAILWIVVLVAIIWHLGGSVPSDQTSACAPVCRNGVCPVKIDPIDFEECACRMMLLLGDQSMGKKKDLSITYSQSNVELALPKGFTAGGEAMMFAPSVYEGGTPVCYNLGVGTSSTTSRIKLNCSRNAGISFNDTIVLSKDMIAGGKFDVQEVPRTRGDVCECWSPSHVRVELVDNNTLIVSWYPFYGHDDLRIRVEETDSNTMRNETKLPNYKLCQSRIQNITFTDFEPGTYVVMVGAVGCGCKTKSESITIDRLTVTKPEIRTISASPVTRDPEVNMTIVLAVVGTLAFISVLALGLILIIRRNRHLQNYHPVYQPQEYQDTEKRAVERVSSHLKELLQGSDVRVTTKSSRIQNNENELELHVSLDDANYMPTELPTTRLEVLMDHTEVDPCTLPLKVWVHPDCPHPAFRGVRMEAPGSLLTLRRVIQLLMPGFDFHTAEFGEFGECVKEESRQMKGNIQNILLVSGNGHDLHVDACKELCRILRTLGKTVKYVLDDSNRRELREEGPLVWMDKHLQTTDLVIIVASQYLHKLMDKHTRGIDCVQLSGYLGSCATFVLTKLAEGSQRCRVAYVSFGYESESIEKIQAVSGVNCSMRYDLVETGGRGQGQHSALKVFLSRLSSDPSLIQTACGHSDTFQDNVEAMKEFLIHNQHWLKDKFSSRDNVLSVSVCSSSNSGQSMYFEQETCL